MNLDETYNIHKKIHCVLPFFKSKWLCKKGIHNYALNDWIEYKPIVEKEYDEEKRYIISKLCRYDKVFYTNLKCLCCGKEIELKDR